ncbi:MAG: hypothetical protein GYA14_09800, partial [Ignavibacteria bacterium]|nr:hypothetical protein [Ignavibacteria bacterium]
LKKYIETLSKDTDAFGFLEVDPELERKLEVLLPEFQPIYNQGIKMNYGGGVIGGRSVFAKNSLKIINKEFVSIYDIGPKDAGGMIYTELRVGGKKISLGVVHGKSLPGDKLDTPERLEQSNRIIDFFSKIDGSKIIGGDFNLLPETQSIKMFEEAGYRNLIKEYEIKSTRNQISWDNFKDFPGFVKQYFADFAFVSPDIKVKSFEVPYVEVSDHLPLILDFDI